MKDKWTLYWIAGLSALLLIGAAAAFLDRPGRALEITVQQSEAAAGTTEAEAGTKASAVRSAAQTQTSAAASEAEPEEPEPPERNLNLADAEALKRVPGIGDALAEAIISARTACGGFTSRMQLCEISGIGETLTERIMAEFEIPDEVFPVQTDPPEPAEVLFPEAPPDESSYYIINVYDVNTVTKEELMTLPDMTEERAEAILTMRQNLRGYRGIYEVSLAEGISGEYFEHVLKAHLYVADDPYSTAQEMLTAPRNEAE